MTAKSEGIDVRGNGGYVIGPGAVRADGGAYVLQAGEMDNCPVLPDWLAEILQPGSFELPTLAAPSVAPSQDLSSDYGANQLMLAAARVRSALPGEWNNTANLEAFGIGLLVGAGHVSLETAFQVLTSAAMTWGISPDDKALGMKGTIRRALLAGRDKHLAAVAHVAADKPTVILTGPGAAMASGSSDELPPSPGASGCPFDAIELYDPHRWLSPLGLIATIVAWVMSTSHRPNRPLAIGSAISVLAGVCGRHLVTPTYSSMNIYTVMLANTAVGKSRPLAAVGQIFRASGFECLCTSIKAFSISAIEAMIVQHPCCVATVDEIVPNLLERMSGKRSSTHERAIRGALLELYGQQRGEPFLTTQRANGSQQAVYEASLSILGASTPDAFYRVMTGGHVVEGFLNRFLIINAAGREKSVEVDPSLKQVPLDIVSAVKAIVPDASILSDNPKVFCDLTAPDFAVLKWENDATKQAARNLEEAILKIADEKPDIEPLIGRVFENSVRLASLHAVSREGRHATVTYDDLTWGASLAISSARQLIEGASSHMAQGEYEER